MRKPANAKVLYPFLARNEDQNPDCPVLSPDGKEVLPRLPEGATLATYTEKELWLCEVAYWNLDYHFSDYYGDTILEILHEADFLYLSEAIKVLAKAIARDRRGSIVDPVSDSLGELPPLPATDRKRIRREHIVLQIMCRRDDNGLDTGHNQFECQLCKKGFEVLPPKQERRAAESSEDADDSERGCPIVRLGFSEVKRLIDDVLCVKCPHCGRDTHL